MSNLGQILDGLRRERWEEEGLVGNFKSQLNENGIEILPRKGNTFSLRKEEKEILLSAHEYTPQTLATEGKGWWAVSQNFIEEAEAGSGELSWGIVFMLGSSTSEAWTGYWVSDAKFEEVEAGAPDSDGKRHIYLEKVERAAERFYSVKEFCSLIDI
jgi:hypothetical protein